MYTYTDIGALVLNSYPPWPGDMPGDRYEEQHDPARASQAFAAWVTGQVINSEGGFRRWG